MMSKVIQLSEKERLIPAVHRVLAGCQRYMREQEVIIINLFNIKIAFLVLG